MKKASTFMLVCLIFMMTCATVNAQDYYMAQLPLEDPIDDVAWITGLTDPITYGDYYDEIDIVLIFRNNSDLVMECCGPPDPDAYHYYYIRINNDSDKYAEFTTEVSNPGVMRVHLKTYTVSPIYWNGVAWTSTMSNCPYEFYGNYTIFKDVFVAIPNANGFVGMAQYHEPGEDTYTDMADAFKPIPGFQFLLLPFTLVAILALISIYKSKRFKCSDYS